MSQMEINSMIICRRATKSDLKAMLEILNYEIIHSTSVYHYEEKDLDYFTDWFDSKLERNYPVFVAELNGNVVGYSTYDRYRPFDGFNRSVEHSIYVHHDFRNHKIGHLLMEELIKQAHLDGLKAMIGGIDKENLKSVTFHLKYGFKIVGELPDIGFKFDKYLTLIFMQKTF
jgi:L-amino acid N-acyltransferase YncA